jgi:hypothetical protein
MSRDAAGAPRIVPLAIPMMAASLTVAVAQVITLAMLGHDALYILTLTGLEQTGAAASALALNIANVACIAAVGGAPPAAMSSGSSSSSPRRPRPVTTAFASGWVPSSSPSAGGRRWRPSSPPRATSRTSCGSPSWFMRATSAVRSWRAAVA